MTNEEAKVFLDNLKICINEHPIVADWLVEIENRNDEPSNSENPNNSTGYNLSPVVDEPQTEDLQDWKDRMWAEAVEASKTEPQTEMPRCSVNGTPFDECGFCEFFNCDTCKCEADVTQAERSSE